MTRIQMPKNNPYDIGARDAVSAIETGTAYLPAYGSAVAEMLNYQDPMSYLRGFLQTYRAEESKQLVS